MEYRKCSLEGMEGLGCMNTKFWKNKNVLITGYEGFLGSHLTKALLDLKANIYGLDILIRRKRTILSKEDLGKINTIKGSVENLLLLSKIIKKNKIEIVFHLAAKSLVGQGLQKPIKTFSTNVRGTWNVLEASRNNTSVKAIIVASSDKAYGSHKNLPYKENFSLCADHPYDVSKSCADLLSYTYYHTYSLPVAITRCGNIYGPGDFNFSRIIPDTIRCALSDKILLIRSNGRFVRDYIFIDDIVKGYVLLAEKLQKLKLAGEAFNFSNEDPVTVIELVEKIYRIIGKKLNYRILNEAKYEIEHQYLSSEKARKTLSWKPSYGLDKGLSLTIDWYRGLLGK
jgi:CDP-glucose 4,6-dehydratase